MLYIDLNNRKAYTARARNNAIKALSEVDGAFENWLDENYLPSEILGTSECELRTEFIMALEAEWDDEHFVVEVELV